MKETPEDAFLVVDLNTVRKQYERFVKEFRGKVKPFFAVKCNPDEEIIAELARCGAGFDVASKGEIETVTNVLSRIGVTNAELIFANPCKQESHIRFAKTYGVNRMTFDNEEELRKIVTINPEAELVVRILGDDSFSVCKFNTKFGIDVKELLPLLKLAKQLHANVIGVSFHVGSGCKSAFSFVDAVRKAKQAFDLFPLAGLNRATLLDMGGGWPGLLVGEKEENNKQVTFEEIACELRPVLEELFGDDEEMTIIAEPGRYFVHSCATLACAVTSKRTIYVTNSTSSSSSSSSSSDEEINVEKKFRYYVNESVYGSFNNTIFDHVNNVTPCVIITPSGEIRNHNQEEMFEAALFGNTCDSIDCINKSVYLPELEINSWLIFDHFGAYTNAAASNFNGFDFSKKFYIR